MKHLIASHLSGKMLKNIKTELCLIGDGRTGEYQKRKQGENV